MDPPDRELFSVLELWDHYFSKSILKLAVESSGKQVRDLQFLLHLSSDVVAVKGVLLWKLQMLEHLFLFK